MAEVADAGRAGGGAPVAAAARGSEVWWYAGCIGLFLVCPLLLPAAAMGIVGGQRALAWFRSEHERVRADALCGRVAGDAVQRLFRAPLRALLLIVGFSIALHGVFDVKWSSFLWEALPPESVAGETYAWPGVYAAETIQHDDPGRSWYVTGGPYVPMPDDTPREAAERMVSYLHDRFDVDADPAHVEEVFATHRGEIPPETLRASAGSIDHPYTAGLSALQDEYSGAVLDSMLLRTLAVALAVLLAGAAVIRIGIARPPAWVAAKPVGVVLSLVTVALVAAQFLTDAPYRLFEAGAPLFHFHARHAVVVSVAMVALSVWLLATARRRARALADALARPV